MSQRIHTFLNILKTSIPSCFWVSRECNFKICDLIWLSTKFAWGLVGKEKKPQEVDFSLGSQNKVQRQDSVMGSLVLQDRSWILLPLPLPQGSTWGGPDFIPSLEPVSLSQCGIFLFFLGIKSTSQDRDFVGFSGKINKLLGPMTASGHAEGSGKCCMVLLVQWCCKPTSENAHSVLGGFPSCHAWFQPVKSRTEIVLFLFCFVSHWEI